MVYHVFSDVRYVVPSGDIRDQSRKLSEIAPKFGPFWPSQILGGGLPKIVSTLSPLLRGTWSGKVS